MSAIKPKVVVVRQHLEVDFLLTQTSLTQTLSLLYFRSQLSSSRHSPLCLQKPKTGMAAMPLLLLLPLLFTLSSAHTHNVIRVTNNPADQLVAVLNSNRTAHKNSSLYDNPGLACIALQYIKAYQGDCSAVGGADAKKPADSEFTETFAPNCGVTVSTLSTITGRLLGCQSKYVKPSEAFSQILMENEKSLQILYSKNHTEVGAAVTGTDGGSPYFWCVLFSNGKRNSSFSLEDGVAKVSKPGCFSGANDECSSANDWPRPLSLWPYAATALIILVYAFGL